MQLSVGFCPQKLGSGRKSLDQQYPVFNRAETPVGQIWHIKVLIEEVQEAGCRKRTLDKFRVAGAIRTARI